MGDDFTSGSITVLCFGPLADILGKTTNLAIQGGLTCREIITKLSISEWLENGLKIAINGTICDVETYVTPGDELALLPPVSGG